MSAPFSSELDRFLALLMAGHLVGLSQLRDACADLHLDGRQSNSVDRLCDHLIGKGLITPWQCEKLKLGRYKGFYLDGFRLLDKLADEAYACNYLAVESRTGRRVTLRVYPPAVAPPEDGQVQYDVIEHEASR